MLSNSRALVPYRPQVPDGFDRSKDPVLIRETLHKAGRGLPTVNIKVEYEDTKGPHAKFDQWAEYDVWVVARMMSVLDAEYPGHHWRCKHDSIQGVAMIANWALMGFNNWIAINLKQYELSPQLIIRVGGEILERYRLRRGALELGSFLEARDKLGSLVYRRRKVPT